ncbi:hypothetical protein [Caballeronia hypogeia]|uniref:hypothetical protein n=1 Tax=Caballeronia hypogeia TaxID=1777140 RepID=UPI0009417073|nr:hypothetical protein [Caballeronia hypogeia]
MIDKHLVRPENTEGTIYERHFPQADMIFSLRTADSEADSEARSPPSSAVKRRSTRYSIGDFASRSRIRYAVPRDPPPRCKRT